MIGSAQHAAIAVSVAHLFPTLIQPLLGEKFHLRAFSGWTYFQPLSTILSVICVAGLVRFRLRRKPALLWIGVLGFVAVSWPPIEWLMSRPLEAAYPPELFQHTPNVEAIVVLAGGVQNANGERPFPNPEESTLSRCEYAAWMYRHGPEVPILASGGGEPYPYAATMRELLRRAGVDERMIWTEERSNNTYENALYSAEILRQRGVRRIALVTEARLMRRAQACFQKQGLMVVPAPSEFREWCPLSVELFPSWRAIRDNENTLHEAVGLAWYRLKGWI